MLLQLKPNEFKSCQVLIVKLNIRVSKKYVMFATIVKGDPKAPFSIATTPKCRGGRYSIPWIAPLYPWNLLYNDEDGIKYHFLVFGITRPGIEPWSPGPLVNTLLIRPIYEMTQKFRQYIDAQNLGVLNMHMSIYIYIYIYI